MSHKLKISFWHFCFSKTTLCPRKSSTAVHETHGDNFVNSVKILSLLEREVHFQQNPHTSHHTFSMVRKL